MKKIIVLMMLFSIIFINRVIADGTNDSDDSNRIEIEINKIKNDYERTLDFPIIEAICFSDIRQMEVTLYNIGEAEVYIVNSQNQVISCTTVQTDAPTTVNMNINGGQGTYYIVVMSEKWYAEGTFYL